MMDAVEAEVGNSRFLAIHNHLLPCPSLILQIPSLHGNSHFRLCHPLHLLHWFGDIPVYNFLHQVLSYRLLYPKRE